MACFKATSWIIRGFIVVDFIAVFLLLLTAYRQSAIDTSTTGYLIGIGSNLADQLINKTTNTLIPSAAPIVAALAGSALDQRYLAAIILSFIGIVAGILSCLCCD